MTNARTDSLNYSIYQQDIFDWIQTGEGHAVVVARAGSGKTFTIENALKFIPSDQNVLFMAFNRHIANELKERVAQPNVDVATLNGFGWRICRANSRGVRLSKDKTKWIIKDLIPNWEDRRKVLGCMIKLVSLRKATGISDLDELAAKFDIDMPDEFDEGLFETTWDIAVGKTKSMDFDDQIFMPIHCGWSVPKYDWVFVDEAQDLSPTQVQLVAKAGTRIVAVGDDRQAIYGFRGADPYAIDHIKDVLEPTVLPLNVCYRCPTSILDEARKIVPDIENAPGAAVGQVLTRKLDPMDGDYVLCRTTAPLVSECLKLIGQGRKAVVKGRDIGVALKTLMKKVGTERTLTEFAGHLEEHRRSEVERLSRLDRDTQIQSLDDKVKCIEVLMVGCTHVSDVLNRIDTIFSEFSRGVTFCTVHRAKGLQAPHIWILKPELMPFPKAKLEWQRQQEMNLKYVAITRAQETLTWVC